MDCPHCGLPSARVDVDSCDGAYNPPNHPGYNLRVHVAFNSGEVVELDTGRTFKCIGLARQHARTEYPNTDYNIGRA